MRIHKRNTSNGNRTKCGIVLMFREKGTLIWKYWIGDHHHWHWITCKNCKKQMPKSYRTPKQLMEEAT